ncbi:MAG: polysaccharide deacetylase family protein [Acidimicrobiales bacterium]
MYHRVTDDRFDPYSTCVTPATLATHLEVIRESANIVGLDSWRRHTRKAMIVLTFDDGYADNLAYALPVAERYGAPFTVFVTSGMLGDNAGFWWDRLAYMLKGRDRIELRLTIAGRQLKILLRGHESAATALTALHGRLVRLPLTEIERCLSAISEQLNASGPETLDARPLTMEELRLLASNPLVTVGAHTVGHELLAGRSLAEQMAVIGKSKNALESVISRSVVHFAYPFGYGEAFDFNSVEAVRQCAFETACTAINGRVTYLNDKLRLPRRMVGNWEAEEFRQRLRAWRAI